MVDYLEQAIAQSWLFIVAYSPLGIIGLWRWSVWLIKKGYARQYQPATGEFTTSVAVITPVYNENPQLFRRALDSWRANKVSEIIAVIDYTDTACIAIFKEFARRSPGARLVVTEKPGKRPALVEGMQMARSEIVALVDSDTVWDRATKRQALIPFRDPKIGGVATRQNVLKPKTLAQQIFNAQLNLRYLEEMPFMTARGGSVVTCLSGRTAFYRRAAVIPVLDNLLHETFWGQPVISGDDKCLTYLVEAQGWKVAFQQTARVFTPGTPTVRNFLRQRLRWTRNSWRADLRTLTQAWVWRHPRFAWYLLDRVIQPFAQLLSPLFFIVSILLGLGVPAVILAGWWHVGRFLRMYPHLRRHPRDIELIPLYIVLNFYLALVKIYALLTLNRQGWITRWHHSRLPHAPRALQQVAAYGLTMSIVGTLGLGVGLHERMVLQAAQHDTLQQSLRPLSVTPVSAHVVGGLSTGAASGAVIGRHEVQAGDTLSRLALHYGLEPEVLVAHNAVLLPSRNYIEPGLVISVPPVNAQPSAPVRYTTTYQDQGPLRITYNAGTHTIEVRGRGRQITLEDIRQAVGERYLREVSPQQWYLTANLTLKAGVSLRLEQQEVAWLKLKSEPHDFVVITAESGHMLITGTKLTSWDETRQNVDETLADGRSYIVARGHARFDIFSAELAYLGYPPEPQGPAGTTGVTWRLTDQEEALLTGEVRNSRFHHNYHGAHIAGGTGMGWYDNQFYDNTQAGLALDLGTSHAVIERNTLSRNGEQGILLRAQSRYNQIVNNEVAYHRDGIAVNAAVDNIISGNHLRANQRGLHIGQRVQRTLVTSNHFHSNEHSGISAAATAGHNRIQDNLFEKNRLALYLAASNNEISGNTVHANQIGMYLQSPASNNRLYQNKIAGNESYGLYIKALAHEINYAGNNAIKGNRINAVAAVL
ncbi:MAG: glycosyltransferase [Candidatus Andersenbacteria bacterium]